LRILCIRVLRKVVINDFVWPSPELLRIWKRADFVKVVAAELSLSKSEQKK
jgi:hypothetical protein